MSRHHPYSRFVIANLVTLLPFAGLGCGTSWFLPGTGNTLGTITTDSGSQTVQTYSDGKIMRVVHQDGGFYEVDEAGNLIRFTAPNGDSLAFSRTVGGKKNVQYNFEEYGAGTVTVNSPNKDIASAKPSNASDGAPIVDGQTGTSGGGSSGGSSGNAEKCAKLSQHCENMSFILEVVFPVIREDVVNHIMDDRGITNQAARNLAYFGIDAMIEARLNTMLEFCARIQFIQEVGAPPCDE